MACDIWAEKIDAYVDGELPESESSAVAPHLRQCANCAADALDRVQMKRAVSLAGLRYQPSTDFRQKIKNSLSRPSRRSSSLGSSWGWGVGLLPRPLVLLLFLAVAYFVSRERSRRERVYSELADLHV